MNIQVRLNAGLAQAIGNSRLTITLTEEATVADLLAYLRKRHPGLANRLDTAVPMIAGQHAALTQPLIAGQEVALLLPVAGGAV